jgi:hypothetical protein
MRKHTNFRLLYILICIATFLATPEKTMAQPGSGISFQTFYDELSPYGRWIDDPEYGYVWSPDVEPGFQPYATRGYWVMTEYGNTWVSDYTWGWAPFHYGRWHFDNYYGWLWVPGQEWGPAWVAWRSGGGYYGWAPLGPGIHINVSVNIPLFRWIFVPQRYIMSPRLYSYCAPRRTVVNVYNHTTVINNYYTNNNQTYVYGPRAHEIEKHTRSRVRVHQVSNESRPGRTVVDRGAVKVYRPDVSSRRNETPSRVAARGTNGNSPRSEGNNLVDRNEKGNSSRNRDTSADNNRIENRSTGRRDSYQPDMERERLTREDRERTVRTPAPSANQPYAGRAERPYAGRAERAPVTPNNRITERPERVQAPSTNPSYSQRAERRSDPWVAPRQNTHERQPSMENRNSRRPGVGSSQPSVQRSREPNQSRTSQSSSQTQRSQQRRESSSESSGRSRRN